MKQKRIIPIDYYENLKDFRQVFSGSLIKPILNLFIALKLPYLFQFIPKNIFYTISKGFSWVFYGEYKKEMMETTRKIMGDLIDKKYKNLSPSQKEWIISEIVYQNCIHMAEMFLDIMTLLPYFYKSKNLDPFFKIKGIENLHKALEKKKGVVAISGHIGNYLFLWAYMALKGYKINFILEYSSFIGILDLLRRCGIKLIPVSRPENENIKDKIKGKIEKAFKNNEIVVVMQDAGLRHYSLINFFDIPCHTPLGGASFAIKYGAPIIPIFIKSHAKKQLHEITIYPEFKIENNNTDNELDLILYNTFRLNKLLEKEIKKNFVYWNNLAIFHIRKKFSKVFKFDSKPLLDIIINEITFFKNYLQFSYEIDRDDDSIYKILDNTQKALENLKKNQNL
ncbi:MAG: lysophospholipid acyltransferase family protein [Candidatus Helarchaeota archaeon]